MLGTDEAGYGPNLGPLCIAATAWQVADGAAGECLYRCLQDVICSEPVQDRVKLTIADSKALYKSGASLEPLERGVLAALACLKRLPGRWRELWPAVDTTAIAQIDGYPWHSEFDERLPLVAALADICECGLALARGCLATAIELKDVQATALFPAAFNAAVEGCGNKAEVLSLATLRLARRLLEGLPPGNAVVLCDKHGGRNRYAGLLQHVFPDELVLVKGESAALGAYEVRHQGRRIEFRFQPKGEKHLPTALASMTAKYLREAAMRPFNAFWQRHIPRLRPTAGYYTDAVRFLREIGGVQQELRIERELVWRAR